jgi:hypothetical protein
MTQATPSRRTAKRDELSRASRRLADARLRQRQQDTPAHRAEVVARLAEIDALLDAHLEVEPFGLPQSQATAAPRSPGGIGVGEDSSTLRRGVITTADGRNR